MNTTTNPWLTAGWFIGVSALAGGLAAVGSTAADPVATDGALFWAMIGPPLATVGGLLLAGLLLVGAINWQARERQRQEDASA